MRGKLRTVNAAMGLMILLAIFFQASHSFNHLAKQFSKTYCHHIYHEHQTELHHGHNGLEKCFTCEFAFSHTTKAYGNSYSFVNKSFNSKALFGYCYESILFYNGSSSFLRGPPSVFIFLT
jgi:hypothetical protein